MQLCYAKMLDPANVHSDEIQRLRKALTDYLAREKLTQNALAMRCGVQQSTLWRFLAGKTGSVRSGVRRVLRYAEISELHRAHEPDAPDPVSHTRDEFLALLLSERLTATSFARRHGISQSTVSRFLGGRMRSIPAVIADAVAAPSRIAAARSGELDLSEDGRIKRALQEAWDGTPEGRVAIARLLEAVAPVLSGNRSVAR